MVVYKSCVIVFINQEIFLSEMTQGADESTPSFGERMVRTYGPLVALGVVSLPAVAGVGVIEFPVTLPFTVDQSELGVVEAKTWSLLKKSVPSLPLIV